MANRSFRSERQGLVQQQHLGPVDQRLASATRWAAPGELGWACGRRVRRLHRASASSARWVRWAWNRLTAGRTHVLRTSCAGTARSPEDGVHVPVERRQRLTSRHPARSCRRWQLEAGDHPQHRGLAERTVPAWRELAGGCPGPPVHARTGRNACAARAAGSPAVPDAAGVGSSGQCGRLVGHVIPGGLFVGHCRGELNI